MHQRRAFTLVEVMVAVVLLSSAAVFVLQSLASLSRSLAISQKRSQVYDFAASKMAELELEMRREGALESDSGYFRIGSERFTWKVASQLIDPELPLESVVLTISWNMAGKAQSSQYRTMLRVPEDEDEK